MVGETDTRGRRKRTGFLLIVLESELYYTMLPISRVSFNVLGTISLIIWIPARPLMLGGILLSDRNQ